MTDYQPLSKKLCASGDTTTTVTKPKIKKINEIMAVELLEMIVRCVPTERTGKVWHQEELSDIQINRQFQLRYLCRLWLNIVYRNTKLTLVLKRSDGRLRQRRSITVEPAGFEFEQASELFEALTCSTGKATDYPSWANLITHVRLNSNEESTVTVLTRLTNSIRHAVDLSLTLPTATMIGTIKHNFRIPFVTRFPDLALAQLDLWSACHRGMFIREEFIYSARLTDFYLKGASNHLKELHVSLFVLDKALTEFRMRRNSVQETEPWTCRSLHRLKLWIAPLDTKNYDGTNAETRNTAFAIQAKLPAWFPQLKQLHLGWSFNRFQFDFTVLQNFAVLDDLSLMSDFSAYKVRHDCRLASLPNIKTLAISGDGIFPMDFALFVPNVCQLSIFSLDRMTCGHLTRQLTANAKAFQNLQALSLDGSGTRLKINLYSPPNDVRSLLQALEGAPHLTELELKNVCPPGGLSLFDSIPEGVVKLILDCCVVPHWVGYDYNDERWFVWKKRMTQLELNETYKEWIVDLLCRLADSPALKEFSCVAPTPNFKTARNLVAQWRRKVPELIADLSRYSLQGKNLDPISLQSIDFYPVDNSANSLGLTAKLLVSGDTSKAARQLVARIFFKDADYVSY